MIDKACRVLRRTPIDGIALIQAEDIDVASPRGASHNPANTPPHM
jgi:hypothetical protein